MDSDPPASSKQPIAAVPARFTPLDYALYTCTVLVWGFSWAAMHFQNGPVPPPVSILWRFALAVPLMFAFALWRGESLRFSLRNHRYFLLLGLAIFSINFLFFYNASYYVASGLLSVVFSLASIGNVVLGALFFRIRIERRVVIGGLLGVSGVAAMFYPELSGFSFGATALLGLALGVGGTICFCLGNMVSVAAQRQRLPVFASTAWGMLYGSLAMMCFALVRGDAFIFDWRPTYILALLYLSVIGSVIAFGVYFTLLGRIGAARAGYSSVLYPVIALAVSSFVEGYSWTLVSILGLALVIAGNVLVLRKPEAVRDATG